MSISKRNIFSLAAMFLALSANLTGPLQPAAFAKSASKSKVKNTSTSKSSATKSVTPGDAETAIKSQLSSLAEAAGKGDADKMAAFFTSDGAYVDEEGNRVEGRSSIKEHFSNNVRPDKAALRLEAQAIKLIGNDSAWVEGATTRETSQGKHIDSRFTMLLQKKDGAWLIQSASETPVNQKTAVDHLSDLNWLVGEWVAQKGESKVKLTAERVGNGHFLHLKYLLTRPGQTPKVDTQVIGWDPTKDQIVSWHFDSSGGFGYGSWRKLNNKWTVNAEGVEQSGWHSAATNVITLNGNDSFQWQSIRRNADGVMYPDTEALTVKRVSQ